MNKRTTQSPTLPAAVASEKAILGAIVNDRGGSAYNQAAALLKPDDFSLDSNRRIFRRMLDLADRSVPIDLVTLAQELLKAGELESIGGGTYLSSLTDGEPRLDNIEHYISIVKKNSVRRRALHASNATTEELMNADEEASAIIDRDVERMLDLAAATGRDGPRSFREIFQADYKTVDGIAEKARRKPGVATGFRQIDELTAGLQPGNLILVAGRPSMGKSALATDLFRFIGLRLGLPVLFFSIEMDGDEVVERLISAEARVDSHRLRRGTLDQDEWRRVSSAIRRLSDAPVFVDDTGNLNLAALRARARRFKQEHGLALVVLDYLQLMAVPRAENRTQEISALSRGLKVAAKELGCPLVALSQLNRAPEQRGSEGHRPQLSDLRDSGSLEQDADLVAFLYRPEYYLHIEGKLVPPDVAGIAELTIQKQRNGPTGTVPLVFTSEWASFASSHQGGVA